MSKRHGYRKRSQQEHRVEARQQAAANRAAGRGAWTAEEVRENTDKHADKPRCAQCGHTQAYRVHRSGGHSFVWSKAQGEARV